MSSKAIVCTACGAAVPYGRLSCPACGELLASVAGSLRPLVAAAPAKRASLATRATPSVLVDVAPIAEVPTATASAVADPPELDLRSEPTQVASATIEPSTFDARMPWEEEDEPQWPEGQTSWREEMPAVASAESLPVASVTSPSLANAPGAYVPPMLPATPAGPPAPARAWAGHPAGDAPAGDSAMATSASESLMDPARLPEFIGWLAVAGSAMAAVGFLLPWGISVIGASGVDYVDRWGMAGPFHPIVVLAVLAVLGLALVPNPIPLWIRVGLPGLGLGALLLGLTWPYLLYLPGKGPGVVVVASGALILLVAGIIALAIDRHAVEHQAV